MIYSCTAPTDDITMKRNLPHTFSLVFSSKYFALLLLPPKSSLIPLLLLVVKAGLETCHLFPETCDSIQAG